MTRRIIIPPALTILALASLGFIAQRAQAADILVDGNLETGAGSPPFWTATTSITGVPGSTFPAVFEQGPDGKCCVPTDTGLGLLVKPSTSSDGPDYGSPKNYLVDAADYVAWRKNPTDPANGGDPDGYNSWKTNFGTNLNRQVNLKLEHDAVTVNTSMAARTFTFKGYTYWGNGDGVDPTTGYSGGVTTLNSNSPSGSVPSPTQSLFQIDFLDASSNLLGTKTLDLRTGLDQDNHVVQPALTNDAMWHQSVFAVSDPFLGSGNTGATSKIRVRVALNNMVTNYGYQNVLLDNFQLFNSGSFPTTDRLNTATPPGVNGNLDTGGAPVGWTVVTKAWDDQARTIPRTPLPTSVQFANASVNSKANHTMGGSYGAWLRPFVNQTDYPAGSPANNVDGYITQTVAGSAGASYNLSTWWVWELNYGGGTGDPSFLDFMKLEFLDSGNNVIGSPSILDLYQAGMRNSLNNPIQASDWRQFPLVATSPAGTTQVRVTIGATGMYFNHDPSQSAFFDDMSLVETLGGASHILIGVPEPASLVLALLFFAPAAAVRRSRTRGVR